MQNRSIVDVDVMYTHHACGQGVAFALQDKGLLPAPDLPLVPPASTVPRKRAFLTFAQGERPAVLHLVLILEHTPTLADDRLIICGDRRLRSANQSEGVSRQCPSPVGTCSLFGLAIDNDIDCLTPDSQSLTHTVCLRPSFEALRATC